MKVKICGLTTLADARYAAAAGADYLGFIQHPGSPRFIRPETAAEIIEWISGPDTVGVFVDEPADVVNETVAKAGFGLVQLHGEESVETCTQIAAPVIKTISVRANEDMANLLQRMGGYSNAVDFFLLDAFDPYLRGGTGKTIDWTTAQAVAKEFPLFLAGGLRSDNVAGAALTARPLGVDVSSGIESAPGIKDYQKIDAFLAAVRNLDPEEIAQ